MIGPGPDKINRQSSNSLILDYLDYFEFLEILKSEKHQSLTDSLPDNLKSRDASASKNLEKGPIKGACSDSKNDILREWHPFGSMLYTCVQ